MAFDWPDLLVGAILGFLAHWAFVHLKEYSARRKLRKVYGPLAGDYANFRVKDDQTQEATGGTIRLLWQGEGSFKATGLHANGIAEWESTIRMSLEFKGTGTGHYRYIGAENIGTQQVTYSPETRSFIVMGADTSGSRKQFFQRWRRVETGAG